MKLTVIDGYTMNPGDLSWEELGKLGEAFTADEQVILLIDEIDKADLEFPNDLLWELDRMEFHIPETGETVTVAADPDGILPLRQT